MTDVSAPSAPRLPATIGRYRITSRLGRGAMGIVYGARDDQMERDVAIKIMMADLEGEPDTRARFFREAQITSKLLHRNIITVLDLGEEDGRPFIVMELLKGETLGDFLKDTERQTLEQKLDLMVQMCEGLTVAHSKGIVHRDIKPGNLFVLPDGSLKILDFGVARLMSSSITASGLIVGTPDYMSPEQARGRTVDARSDIFSAAAVFYFMVTGRKPFPGPDLPVVLQKVINEDPLPIREHEAPEALARIILRALNKDADHRYQKFADMATELVRFKRQFDGETRQLGTTAKQRFDEVVRAAAVARELAASLRMPADAIDETERGIRERYPFFVADAAGALPVVAPLRRHRLMGILSDLDTILVGLATGNDAWRAAAALTDRAEQALGARDVERAIKRFEEAEQLVGARSERIATGLAAAREAAATIQAAHNRLQALIGEMRAAEQRGDWRAVDELCREALAIDPRSRDVVSLAQRARAALAAEAEARARKIQDLVARAMKASAARRFDEAERLLGEARDLEPDSDAVRAAIATVTDARVQSATADAAARKAAEEIAAKREALVRQRLAQAAAYAQQAQGHWEKHEVNEAVTFAELALALDRTQETAIHIQGLARARLREQAEEAARTAEASAAVAKAIEWLAAGRYDNAAAEAQRALRLQAGRADAAGVLSEARRLEAEAALERQRQTTADEREREIEIILKDVRDAIENRDFGRAVWAAENALLIDPGHGEAKQLLEAARVALTPKALSGDDEGTVPAMPASDPDDTAVIKAREADAALKGLAAVSGWASGLRRRLGAGDGQTTVEWLMIAGFLTAFAVFLLTIVPGALKEFVGGINYGVKWLAP